MSCEVINKIGTGDCDLEKISKSEQKLATAIATELVSEILEDALDIVEEIEEKSTVKVVGDIFDNLSNQFQELVISEEKLKMEKIEGIISTPPLTGLGDQLETDEGIGEETPIKHQTVEKKSRLTDLVKNSKQILAKLMQSESTKETSSGNSPTEKVICVIELDSGDQAPKTAEISPENIPLPRNDSCEILKVLDREDMDEIQLSSFSDKGTQKGEDYKKTMTFPLAGPSEKNLSFSARYRTLKFPYELKKKKWNFGTKIMNYIRKHQAKKEAKQDSVCSIEIQPKSIDD
ncbi:hypothetical protein JTB14_038351 [Gonioctena quinquepunctata]|nr:hypothetical protein JTB14_038351 [Gonioctena quinquepunctata]